MFFFSAFLSVFCVFFFPRKSSRSIHSFHFWSGKKKKQTRKKKKNSFFIHSFDFAQKCEKTNFSGEKKIRYLCIGRFFFNTPVFHTRYHIEQDIVLFQFKCFAALLHPPNPPRLNLQKTLVAQTLSNFCSLHIAYFSIKVPTLHSQTYLSQKNQNFLTFSSLCF